jgi:hypothetical protein
MEPELRDLVKQNLELTKENHRLLKKMRRSALIGGFFKLLWIAVLIGVPVYLYLTFFAPVVQQVTEATQSAQEAGSKLQEIQEQIKNGEFAELLKLIGK